MGEFEHQQAARAVHRTAEEQFDEAAPGRNGNFVPIQQQNTHSTDKTLAMLRGDGEPAAARPTAHAGEPAAAATQELDADAFSTGQAVFFGATRPDPRATRALAYAAKAPTIDGATTGVGGQYEPLARFLQALDAGDISTAKAAWVAASPLDRLKLKTESNTLVRMIRVIGPDSLAMLHQIGVAPAADRRMVQAILHHGSTTWVDALDSYGMLDEFLRVLPRRKGLDLGAVYHLAEYTRKDLATAKAVFEKAYGELREGDFTSGDWTAHGVAWDQDHIRRLYLALQEPGTIPPSHLTGLSGLYIASHYTRDARGRTRLGFGYFASNTIVMPLYAGDGSAGHNMVGAPSSKGAAMRHFASTMLHEVGHLVGEQTGEHAWGTRSDSPLKMEASSADEMREELWDPAKSIPLTEEGADPVSERDAKMYLEAEIRGVHPSTYLITDWGRADKNKARFVANVDRQFREQPLYKMAKAVAGNIDNAYLHPMPGVKTPGKMFAYLRRFNSYAPFAKYEKAAFDARPSWYAMSSALEWFAEQYSHYMTSGGAATLPAVQTKMKAIVSKLENADDNDGSTKRTSTPSATLDDQRIDGPATSPPSVEGNANGSPAAVAPPAREQHIHRFEVQW